MKTYIVPLDGSELAERALPFATALARKTGARLLLLRGIDAVAAVHGVATDPAAELDAVAEKVRASGVEAEPYIYHEYYEDIGSIIVESARRWQAELIIMSTHGRSGLGRFVYGSAADQVLRQTDVPVLLLSPTSAAELPADRPPRIMVTLDGSEFSNEAIGPAAGLAQTLGAELLLLSVVQPPTYAYAEGYAYLPLEPEEEMNELRVELEQTAQPLRAAGLTVKTQVELGFPTTVIADLTREAPADLIVMATHGRGGLARFVLGSVATGTLQRATVPLLLVRPQAAPRPAVEPTTPVALSTPAAPAPTDATVSVDLTAHELDLIERGLGELLFKPEADLQLTQPARELLNRLRLIASTIEPVGAAHGRH